MKENWCYERMLEDRAEQSVLRWFGHMERMEELLLVKRIVDPM